MWHSALRYPVLFLTGFLALFGAGRIARHDLHDVFFRTLTEYQDRNTVHIGTEIQAVAAQVWASLNPFPVSGACRYLKVMVSCLMPEVFAGFSLDVQPTAAP